MHSTNPPEEMLIVGQGWNQEQRSQHQTRALNTQGQLQHSLSQQVEADLACVTELTPNPRGKLSLPFQRTLQVFFLVYCSARCHKPNKDPTHGHERGSAPFLLPQLPAGSILLSGAPHRQRDLANYQHFVVLSNSSFSAQQHFKGLWQNYQRE